MKKERNINLDVIRCFAIVLVICLHFFFNGGYYKQIMHGEKLMLMATMRTFTSNCIPLFLMLTGYLMADKKVTLRSYPARAAKIFIPYVLITVFMIVVSKVWLQTSLTKLDFWAALRNILVYEQYSWYVSMYLGLLLLIPFLNKWWSALSSKKEETLFIAVLLVIGTLPSLLNYFDLTFAHGWKTLLLSEDYTTLMPGWWESGTSLYPLTYFFIGAYIKKHFQPGSIRKRYLLLVLALCVPLFGLHNFYRSYGKTFVWGRWTAYGAYQCVIMSIPLFLLLLSIRFERLPALCKSAIARMSSLAYGTFIASWIVDKFVYSWVKTNTSYLPDRYWIAVPIVLAVFAGSMFISLAADLLYKGIVYLWNRARRGKNLPA
ncbi:MAG: acyltransferase family protein [Oscillospiraceae bacterium]|nr:acyltransferase family protein [Oscillospiraceae bacterium]